MKTLLLLLFLPLSIFAQDYLPFPIESAKWTNGFYDLNTNDPNYFFFELSYTEIFEPIGDTLINSLNYTIIQYSNQETLYAGAIREAEGIVYLVPPDSINEGVLYDFTLDVGDTTLIYCSDYYYFDGLFVEAEVVVESVSSIEINGEMHKVLNFYNGSWIEGIGSDRGFMREVYSNISNYWTYLKCFELEGNQIFSTNGADQGCILSASHTSADSELSVYPNPSNGRIRLQGTEQIFGYQLIDQQGRLIRESKLNTSPNSIALDLSEEKKGIYLIRTETNLGISAHRIVIQ